jgi:hypothetical protein
MGDFGIYFPVGDVTELAHQLLAATQIDWPAKSREALAMAARFNIDSIINEWKQLIDEQ